MKIMSFLARFKRGRDVRLVPVQELVSIGPNRWQTTGNDPQFALLLKCKHFTGKRVRLTLDFEAVSGSLKPEIFAFTGNAGDDFKVIKVPPSQSEQISAVFRFPRSLHHIRLDPTDEVGVTFTLRRATIARVGLIGRFRHIWRSMNASERASLLAACRRFDLRYVRSRWRTARERIFGAVAQYENWVRLYDTLTESDCNAIRQRVAKMTSPPLISVVMPVYNSQPEFLRAALDSLKDQLYPHWEACIADDASTRTEIRPILEEYAKEDARFKIVFREKNGHIALASNSALEIANGAFTALMDHDDLLPPHALYLVAQTIVDHPDTDLIYTDEDKVDENGRRHDPYFKSDWNQELFLGQNFVAHLGVYRTAIARDIGGFRAGFEGSQDYDFALRFLRRTQAERIRHIPHVLYHWRIYPGVSSFSTDNARASLETARRALTEYLAGVEPQAQLIRLEAFPTFWRIKRPVPDPAPRVSVIIPTRDRVDFLKVCVEGLRHKTEYSDLEIIIVDNDSKEPETLAYLRELTDAGAAKIVPVREPFNFSRLTNAGAAVATGSVLCLLNNDIGVIHPDWLSEMVSQVARPGVGAVGAKLVYANDKLQHAGVILGIYGVAAHSHRHMPKSTIGYFGRAALAQNLSAVTAACMLVPAAVYREVGGLDETKLTVGYNDVDLCLKIRALGYSVVYTPFAELYHYESISRGANVTQEQISRDAAEREVMLARWPEVIANDPFYNPNLTVSCEDFSLAYPPRVAKRWLQGAVEKV